MANNSSKLSGQVAYDLFMSYTVSPLACWLEDWRNGSIHATAGHAIAVVNAYGDMIRQCEDGRYKRPDGTTIVRTC